MLIGSYNHIVDQKNRLFIPSRWRDDLGGVFVITKGFDKYILGMSLEKWETFSAKMSTLPLLDKKAQDFVRYMSSWAIDCELDKQGRILLPSKLKSFAEIEMEATLIGVTGRIEIWNSKLWEKHSGGMEEGYDEIISRIEELGL